MANLLIGHSSAESQTFFPDFIQEPNSKVIFGDIAGFQDTNGLMIEMYNIFISKMIFRYACFLRFIVPMTYCQIKEDRGIQVRK